MKMAELLPLKVYLCTFGGGDFICLMTLICLYNFEYFYMYVKKSTSSEEKLVFTN